MTEVATTAGSPASTDLRNTILAVQQWLNHGLVGRKKEIKSVLLTLLAGENIVLIGPPGTAKSLLARRISQVVAQPDDGSAPYFEYLLTKFSTPEELFGPLSIAELKQDRFRRNTAGYLPTVQVAFLDEIFKASSSILNALLTVLNERAYHNGAQAEKIPLQALVAASNELPTGDSELAALYDRFLLRHYVGYLDEQKRGELFALSDADAESDDNAGNNAGNNATPPHRFSADALQHIRQQAQRVRFPAEIQQAMQTLWKKHADAFQDNALEQLSDRRFVKLQQLLRVSAATNGRDAVDMSDLMLLKDCLWNSDANRHTVRELIKTVLGGMDRLVPADAVDAAETEGVAENTAAAMPIPAPLSSVVKGYKGSGTKDDPLLIENLHHLHGLDKAEVGQQGYYFRQAADLDGGNMKWQPISEFKGHYDGAGHSIRFNMTGYGVPFLFDYVEESSFLHLITKGCGIARSISDTDIRQCQSDCFLTATAIDSRIRECLLNLDFNGNGRKTEIGGVSGGIIGTEIHACLVQGVIGYHGITAPDDLYVSGIAWSCDRSSHITKCSVGSITRHTRSSAYVQLKHRITASKDESSTLSENVSVPQNWGGDCPDSKEIDPQMLYSQYYFEHSMDWDFDTVWQWDDESNLPVFRDDLASGFAGAAGMEDGDGTVSLLRQQLQNNIWL